MAAAVNSQSYDYELSSRACVPLFYPAGRLTFTASRPTGGRAFEDEYYRHQASRIAYHKERAILATTILYRTSTMSINKRSTE